MKVVFDDEAFSYQLLRTLGYAPYKGADIGECLQTAYRIKEGDFESWYQEWFDTAERIRGIADASLNSGDNISARETYLRASNYYRSAEFFIHGDPADARILETSRKSRESFQQAAALREPPLESVTMAYEITTLPGYFIKADTSMAPKPTLILNTGFDGTAEELYFTGAAAASRGYQCLLFEGPGQGRVIREQSIPFRPDWEKVITPVVDYLLARKDVMSARIALYGISLGGYLAPRAAAFEHRLAACIANGGVFSLFQVFADNRGLSEEEAERYVTDSPEGLDKSVEEAMKHNSELRWGVEDGMWKFNAKTPHEYVLKLKAYSMADCADKVACPTLVIDSEKDTKFPGQARKLYEALRSEKEFMLFTVRDAAEEHCQAGASLLSNQRVFDWLDKTFKKSKRS